MGWVTGLQRNWADTDEPGDPALAPVELPLPPSEVVARLPTLIVTLPRWRVDAVLTQTEERVIQASRRTRLFHFVDDITIRLEPTATGTRVHARSQSRIGKGDLGQNRRNLLELLASLRQLR